MRQDDRGPSTLLLITHEGMGHGDADLRLKLLGTYLGLLVESGMAPGAIAFYTEGVRLVVEGSPVLDRLRELEALGVRLIVCTTCLKHYGLEGRVAVGIVGGMTDIIAAQWKALKVVTL